MILVQTEDGKITTINKSWNTFHPEGSILKLILTDGKRFKREICNCEGYYVEWEGLSGLNADYLTRETIFGINNCIEVKEEVLKEYNAAIKHVCSTTPKEKIQENLTQLAGRYETLLKKLEKYEVIKYSIIIDEERCLYEDLNIDHKWVKKGIERPKIKAETVFGKRYQSRFKV